MAITSQTFADLELDIAHTGEAVNEKKIIKPRYGLSFKSLPLVAEEAELKADEVVAKGFYLGFANEAAMRAYTPSFSETRAKLDDTKKVYRWERTSAEGVTPITGIWHDTGLSELDQAKEFTNEKNKENQDLIESIAQEVLSILFKSRSKDTLFDFVDKFGSIVMQVTLNGGLKLVGLDKDLVSHLNATFENFNNKHLFLLLDADKNIIAYIDKDAKLFIVGLDTDVATAINSKSSAGLEAKDTSNLSNYSYRDTFIPKADKLLNFFRSTQDVGLIAPVPLHSFEQNFSISDTWVDQAKITEWGDYHPVKTPYGTNRGVVHPQILEFPNKFMGYRYIVTITGYTNGNTVEENPFLLGSNDLDHFELLTDLIDVPESSVWEHGICYNSDPFTFYNVQTGELCLIVRECFGVTDGASIPWKERLFLRKTKDGKSWSERQPFMFDYSGLYMAPAVVFDAKTETYHIYAIGNIDGKAWGIHHYTTKNVSLFSKDNWKYVGACNFNAGDDPWHIDMKFIGDKLVCTYQNRSGQDSIGFRLGISNDFHTFKWANDWWNPPTYEVYKATFLPQFNAQNEMRLVYLWTTNHKPMADLRYKLFVQPTPYLNVNFMEK